MPLALCRRPIGQSLCSRNRNPKSVVIEHGRTFQYGLYWHDVIFFAESPYKICNIVFWLWLNKELALGKMTYYFKSQGVIFAPILTTQKLLALKEKLKKIPRHFLAIVGQQFSVYFVPTLQKLLRVLQPPTQPIY